MTITVHPAIVEYKKNQNDNVINQGLSYLRWLLDHKAEFTILLQDRKVPKKGRLGITESDLHCGELQ